MNMAHTAAQMEHAPKQAARQVQPWVERLARLGYAAKGVVYLVIGILAVEGALGRGGGPTNTQGALAVILQQPFGRFLLGLVGVGLAGYALWRLATAVFDPERQGTDAKGILTRIGYAISGLAYGALAYTAFRLLSGTALNRSNMAVTWTSKLLSMPWGQWLVGLVGAAVIGVGLYGLYTAATAGFRKHMDLHGAHTNAVVGLGRFGYAARGVVFGAIGAYLIRAAVTFNPQQARGLQGAQTALAGQPGGPWILLAVALGLIAYGLFMFAEARYHRVNLDAGTSAAR